MVVGIMGGTFDPIHIGHLIAAETARQSVDLDEVWFIPTHIPPHKKQGPSSNPNHRWEMLCQAVASNPYFRPVDIELKKGGISYSIETIQLLKQLHPQNEWTYIIGADMLEYLPKWVRIEELIHLVTFVVLARQGYELKVNQLSPLFQSRIQIINMPLIEISSSHIRTSLKQNRCNSYFLPERVLTYIKENQLYES
jgi:nicotinate-nucleotide adenylyltransferase